ncbi:MAG TPA: hypothetical protein VIE43_11925 [Thermoanaerobaculia bacterium]|nr:hypothetical protein [Thermoanaerobaculia bacterium]
MAKLYHKAPSREHAEKVRAMVRLKTEALTRVAAWPVDTCHRQPEGEVIGLVMPKISGHYAIHNLYSPKSRLNSFPDATWRFLIHSAANLSRAFAVVHEHGHLVGDVNHGNALVSRQATVRLIDCDSFQVQAGSEQFLCGVGVPTHVPPELQGGPLRVLRTEDHDSFGLAVLIFQILFMGRHPYSGHYLGSGEMPIEKAIREHRFAYGPSAGFRQMRQPPNTLDLVAVSKPIADLFKRAFSPPSPGGIRPRARDWIAALDSVKTSTCGRSAAHLFTEGLATCPWCDLESRSGIVFFFAGSVPPRLSVFDLASVWARIAAVPSPGVTPATPIPATYRMPPSKSALAASRKKVRQISACLVVLTGTAFGIYLASCASIAVIVISISLAAAIAFASNPTREAAKQQLKDLKRNMNGLQVLWTTQASEAPFTSKQNELERLKEEYQDLPSLRQRKIATLEAGRKTSQLGKFLDRHRIDKAKIPGIGDGRTATLQSFGIGTALDVVRHDVLRVPGFGPVLAEALNSWRRSIESKFVFDPSKGVDPADLTALDRAMAARKTQIEQVLQAGVAELEKIRYQISIHRQALLQQLEAAAKAIAQTEADVRVL